MRAYAASLVGACVFVALPISSSAWELRFDSVGPADSQDDSGRSVVFDSAGYVIVGGDLDVIGHRAFVAKLRPGDGSELWRRQLTNEFVSYGDDWLTELAVDSRDDVLATGCFHTPAATYAAMKLGGPSGSELWRADLGICATAVGVDGHGDVFVAGVEQVNGSLTLTDWRVFKLSGVDGSVLWSRVLAGSGTPYAYPYDLAINSSGDAVVVGMMSNAVTATDFTAAKLAGSDGASLWQASLDGGTLLHEYATRVSIDAAGDVYAAGKMAEVGFASAGSRFAVAKLAGETGAQLWRSDLCCGSDPGTAEALALAPDGGVIVGGWSRRQHLAGAMTVARFDPSDGSTDWRVVIPGPTGYGRVNALAVDGAGDVWAAGSVETNALAAADAIALKLHPCYVSDPDEICNELEFSYDVEVAVLDRRDGSGAELEDGWDWDEHLAVAVGPQDNAVFVGDSYERHPVTGNSDPQFDFSVVSLSAGGQSYLGPNPFVAACTDGVDNDGDLLIDVAEDPDCAGGSDLFEEPQTSSAVQLVAGHVVKLRDKFGRPSARRAALQLRDPALALVAPENSAANPALHGAVLELANPVTGERRMMSLPTTGWSALGNPSGARGYRYRDPRGSLGPCTSADLTDGTLRVSCHGRLLEFSLDEPSQGAISAAIHFADGSRICGQFGGSAGGAIVRDTGASSSQPVGQYLAQGSAAPTFCP